MFGGISQEVSNVCKCSVTEGREPRTADETNTCLCGRRLVGGHGSASNRRLSCLPMPAVFGA